MTSEPSDAISTPPAAADAAAPPVRDPWEGFFSLDPRSVGMDRAIGLVVTVILGLAGVTAMLIYGWLSSGFTNTWAGLLIGIGVIVVGLLASSWYWPAWEYHASRWRCDEVGLEVHRGIWWRHRRSVPLSRIQHVDVAQGPIQRRYGLAKLVVHTAGTQHASVELPNIAWETAQWLRDQLMASREVVDGV